MSKQFEHDVVNEFNRNTPAHGYAVRDGYSGSGATAFADTWFMYMEPTTHYASIYAGELKKRGGVTTGNRRVVMSGSAEGQNGIEELKSMIDAAPPFVEVIVGIKFNQKQLAVFSATQLLKQLRADTRPEPFKPKLTRGGNVSMVKPEHTTTVSSDTVVGEGDSTESPEHWPSKTSGMDNWECVIDYIKRGMGHINEPRSSLTGR